MNHDDVAFIDGIVTEYRACLLKIPYLNRANRAQRRGLAEAHSLVLSLPALARERAQQQFDAETNRVCAESEALARSERT